MVFFVIQIPFFCVCIVAIEEDMSLTRGVRVMEGGGWAGGEEKQL